MAVITGTLGRSQREKDGTTYVNWSVDGIQFSVAREIDPETLPATGEVVAVTVIQLFPREGAGSGRPYLLGTSVRSVV